MRDSQDLQEFVSEFTPLAWDEEWLHDLTDMRNEAAEERYLPEDWEDYEDERLDWYCDLYAEASLAQWD